MTAYGQFCAENSPKFIRVAGKHKTVISLKLDFILTIIKTKLKAQQQTITSFITSQIHSMLKCISKRQGKYNMVKLKTVKCAFAQFICQDRQLMYKI